MSMCSNGIRVRQFASLRRFEDEEGQGKED